MMLFLQYMNNGRAIKIVTVDTHIIIWDALDPNRLSKNARIEYDKANQSDGLLFCDISLWEISMLINKKRVEIDISFLEFINLLKKSRNYVFQSITPKIADISTRLITEINSDPADRLIAATSLCFNSPLITADKNLLDSTVLKTIW